MCKNMVQPDRPQMTIYYGACGFACCITKAADAHSEYAILIAFPRQQWLRERASILRYAYTACLVSLMLTMLTDVSVLWYQPSCHNSSNLAIVFKFVAANIFASALQTHGNWSTNSPCIIRISGDLFLVMKLEAI
jgi:hypothetical protein